MVSDWILKSRVHLFPFIVSLAITVFLLNFSQSGTSVVSGLLETIIVGLAFGVTMINVYTAQIYVDEKVNENRLSATSPLGIFWAAVVAGIFVHTFNAYIFPGKIKWAHCGK